MKKDNKEKFLQEAKNYEDLRDKLGRDEIENFKFLKGQIADWYIAITAACFAIGGISISLAGDDVKHPALFWWGSVLLIANGVLIFFVRKTELDSEFSESPDLKQKEADLWTMSKIAREHTEGDSSRSDEFVNVYKRFASDYERRSEPYKWWQWVKFAAQSSMLNIVFGLLLFPVLLLASQLPNYMHISLRLYTSIMLMLIFLYVIYVLVGLTLAIKRKKRLNTAELQIKLEVTGGKNAA